MSSSLDDLKKLRELTGAGVLDCRKTLDRFGGDYKLALAELKKKGLEVAEKKKDRVTKQGIIEAYSHNKGKIVAVVEVLCETDFVARNEDFKHFAHELALQISAMNPQSVGELMGQPYIRDPKLTIDQLHKSLVAKIRENIQIGRIARYELGEGKL